VPKGVRGADLLQEVRDALDMSERGVASAAALRVSHDLFKIFVRYFFGLIRWNVTYPNPPLVGRVAGGLAVPGWLTALLVR
jgi:hypothetical protein